MKINRTVPIYSISLITIVLCGLLSTQATAASFDCNKAATWVEKSVCSNPELSKLDEEMAKAYSNALSSLSPEGQKETKQYQKQWIKDISPYCKARQKLKFVDDAAKCLNHAYKERITQLQQIFIKFPDRIFRNVHISHSENKETCEYVFVEKELRYPQIENPRDKNERFWNILISQKVSNAFENPIDNECTNTDVRYTVSFSNKHLISVQRMDFYYRHSAPHGYASVRSFSWLLEGNKELQTSDLFDEKTDWRNKLAAFVTQKLKEDKEETYIIKPSIIMDTVSYSDHWKILKDGLGIQFNEYDLGNRVAPLITIDWKTLDPYLSKNGRSLISD